MPSIGSRATSLIHNALIPPNAWSERADFVHSRHEHNPIMHMDTRKEINGGDYGALRYHYKYPHPSVTADCVMFGYDGSELSVLLVMRGNEPFKGCWAFPGGFINIDECAEQGALRELWEETGLRARRMRQFHTFSEPGRDPRERVISIAFYSLVRKHEVVGGDDAADACWFTVSDVPRLAFDHGEMLRLALKELRRQAQTEPIGMEALPEKFTADELFGLYKAINGTALSRSALMDKLAAAGVIERDDGKEPEAACRGDALMKFNRERYNELGIGGFGQIL